MQILIAEQASTRETHATIWGMSISMATLICSCSDLAGVPTIVKIVDEMIWARWLPCAISLQYQSKPLTTTVSSACLQPE